MQIGGGGATKTVRVDERRKGVALGREEAREGEKMATIRDIRPVRKERFLPGYEHDRRG